MLPFELPHSVLAREVYAHLSDAASGPAPIEFDRLVHVAHTYGFDLEVELGLIASGPTPRANLRRLALQVARS